MIRALQAGDARESIAAMQQHFDDMRVRAALLRTPASDAG
jgi:DNA-binding GntR family transcriptional regulator